MSLNFYWVLFLLSEFQVVLVSFVLFQKRGKNRTSNILFGLLILSYGIILADSFTRSTWAWMHFTKIHWLIFLFSTFAFTIGPLSLFYIKSILINQFTVKKSDFLHFLPFIFALVCASIHILNTEEFIIWYSPLNQVYVYLILIHSVLYLIPGIIIFTRAKQEGISFRMKIKPDPSDWAKFIIASYTLLWLVKLQSFAILQVMKKIKWCAYTESVYYSVFFIAVNSVVMYLMIKPEFVHPKIKYVKSNLSPEKIETIADKIRQMLEQDKIYKNPDLNLKELSNNLKLSPKYVSEIINGFFKKNFIGLVNYFRIEESKSILLNKPEISVKEVCYDVGFNSRSAFNSAFKKLTGVSPSDFQNNSNEKNFPDT